jgi:hypothetical protein
VGLLHQAIDIKYVIETFEIETVVETGTGEGDSLKAIQGVANQIYAQTGKVIEIHTIECMSEIMDRARRRFGKWPQNIHPYEGYSEEKLPLVLQNISPGPALFWLDAHFPGADFGLGSYSDGEHHIKLPLETELKIVTQVRTLHEDVFVLDDLRIYKDGPFEGGNWPERPQFPDENQFMYDMLDSTHHIFETTPQQGYTIAYPKEFSPILWELFIQGSILQ